MCDATEPKLTLTEDMPIRRPSWADSDSHAILVDHLPKELFDSNAERYCHSVYGQTLEQVRRWRGLTSSEALAIILGTSWSCMDQDKSHHILYTMRALYRRGSLHAPLAEMTNGRTQVKTPGRITVGWQQPAQLRLVDPAEA